MPPSGSFGGPKGQKWPKVFPLAKIEISFFRAENFFVVTRTKSGCVRVFFFEKYQIHTSGEAKYWKNRQKPFFSDGTNFLKAAKFYRNDILKQKKNTHPDLTEVLVKKISARPVQPFPRKRGKTFFFLLKNWFWEKPKIKKNFLFGHWMYIERASLEKCFSHKQHKNIIRKTKIFFEI